MISLQALVTALTALALLSLATTTLSHVFLWMSVASTSRHRNPKAFSATTRVTLLKPLCGVDDSLELNLQGVAEQDHARFEVVFGVSRRDDPALAFAQRFVQRHSNLRTTISLGETFGCINPKVALLDRMVETSRTQWPEMGPQNHWFVVSDSNVRLQPDYLSEALQRIEEGVGLITHFVSGSGGDSFAAHLENLQLNAHIAPAVAGAKYFAGRTCVIGKSIFIREDVLQAIGGFKAVGHVLAEDYILGRLVNNAGYRARFAFQPVQAWHEGWTLSRFLNRHGRWAAMRRRISLAAYLLEPLLLPIPLLMTLMLLLNWVETPPLSGGTVAIGLGWTMALVAVTSRRLTGQWLPVEAWLCNLLREWLTLAIWVKGWFLRRIEWRGKFYRVMRGSVLEPYDGNTGLEHGVADEA